MNKNRSQNNEIDFIVAYAPQSHFKRSLKGVRRMKGMKLIVSGLACLLMVGVFANIALARPALLPDYTEMVEDAQLILIGTPISRTEMVDLTAIPGVRRGNDPIPAVAIKTKFSPVTILKGSLPKGKRKHLCYTTYERRSPKMYKETLQC
jgi:hypothetical protein